MKYKKNAYLILIVLVFFSAISWVAVFNNKEALNKEYEETLEKAMALEEKGIYIDAVDLYQKAHSIKPNDYDIALKIVNSQMALNDENGFLNACDKAIQINPTDDEVYLLKANFLIEKRRYKEAISVLDSASKVKDMAKINEILDDIKYEYINKYIQCDEMKNWYAVDNSTYSTVKVGDKWGVITSSGNRVLGSNFDYLGGYSIEQGVIPCMSDGEYYYIDINGNRKLVGDDEYQHLGTFGEGYAAAQKDNKYGYIDRDFNEFSFEYEFAGGFAHGIAAVKSGGKWAIIDKKFKTVTDFIYDEILVDDYGFCSRFGVFFAKKDGEYRLYDTSGSEISTRGYTDAKIFTSGEPAAVKVDDKWGWIDINGEEYIGPQYEDAQSFSLGLAPVLVDGIWGYINKDNKIVIAPEFESAQAFSNKGSAYVKNEDKWSLILLCEYDK